MPTSSYLNTWPATCKHLLKSVILRGVWNLNTSSTEDVWTSAGSQHKKKKKQVQAEKAERQRNVAWE